MAIVVRRRKKGITYQVKVEGDDGRFVTGTFERKSDAEKYEAELFARKRAGYAVSGWANRVTLDEYLEHWHTHTKNACVSEGWRRDQLSYYRRYVAPVVGQLRLQALTPAHVQSVMDRMSEMGRSSQMRLHVYNLLHKMFEDAIELFELVTRNPVIRRIRPKPEYKEARFLSLAEARKLLLAVEGTSIEAAIWLQLYTGLRVGEIQALRWSDLDFQRSTLIVRGTFVRKEKRFKDSPKGKKQHTLFLPEELKTFLLRWKERSRSDYVASFRIKPINYGTYYKALKLVCEKSGVPSIGTHGLRHSTSEIYIEHGATHDDIRRLLGHSRGEVTERYIHGRGSLERVAKVISLSNYERNGMRVSPKFPQTETKGETSSEESRSTVSVKP